MNELASRRAPATVVKAAQIMGKVMKTAVRSRMIAHNPMAEVSLPTIVESEDFYLTPAQVADLADAMTTVAPRYRALVWAVTPALASVSCCRCGGQTSTSSAAR